MNEDLELMMHVYKGAEMGVYTTTNLINALKKKENKIKHVLEMELKEYEHYMKQTQNILLKNNVEPKNSNPMAKIGSDFGIAFETMKDNSDPAIAQMLIEGFTMGSVDMTAKIKNYKSTSSKEYLQIAQNYLKFHENEIEKLKTFM